MKLINLMVGALAITRVGASAGRSNNTDACEIKHLKNIKALEHSMLFIVLITYGTATLIIKRCPV